MHNNDCIVKQSVLFILHEIDREDIDYKRMLILAKYYRFKYHREWEIYTGNTQLSTYKTFDQ